MGPFCGVNITMASWDGGGACIARNVERPTCRVPGVPATNMGKCSCAYLGMIDRRRARFHAEDARTCARMIERSVALISRSARFEEDKATELAVTVGSLRQAVRSCEVNIYTL